MESYLAVLGEFIFLKWKRKISTTFNVNIVVDRGVARVGSC